MSDLTRASLSIESELMERFDRLIAKGGHGNRSEAIRDLIRARLVEEEQLEGSALAVASVTVVYSHAKRTLARQLEEYGHEHHDVIVSSMHVHASVDVCLEVVALRGPLDELKHVAGHLIGMPGVLHGRAVYSLIEGT